MKDLFDQSNHNNPTPNVTLDLQPCELKITCFIINRHNIWYWKLKRTSLVSLGPNNTAPSLVCDRSDSWTWYMWRLTKNVTPPELGGRVSTLWHFTTCVQSVQAVHSVHCRGGTLPGPSAGTRVGALGDRDSAGARARRGKLRHAARLRRRMLGRGWAAGCGRRRWIFNVTAGVTQLIMWSSETRLSPAL